MAKRARRYLIRRASDGQLVAELEGAVRGPIVWQLNAPAELSVDLSADDPKAGDALGKLYELTCRINVGAGDELVVGGPIVRPSMSENGMLTLAARDAAWWLGARTIGAERRNQLDYSDGTDPDLTDETDGWKFLATTGDLDFTEAMTANTKVEQHSTPAFRGVANVFRFYRLGAAEGIEPLLQQAVTVEGGDFGREVTAVAYHRIATGTTVEEGHGLELIRLPDGWLDLTHPDTGIDYDFRNLVWARRLLVGDPDDWSDFSEVDPTEEPPAVWVRHEASVFVPPGETEEVLLRLSTPARGGLSTWANPQLYVDDALEFADEDLADIVEGIVDHLQDPAFGHTALNLAASLSATGTTIDRRWPYVDRSTGLDALGELADAGLLDWAAETDAAGDHSIAIYAPQRTDRLGFTLRSGIHIARFSWAWDGDKAGNSAITLSPDTDTAARQEGLATDSAAFAEALDVQRVHVAPDGTHDEDLDDLAAELLDVIIDPDIVTLTTTTEDAGTELLGVLWPGVTIPVDLNRGAVAIAGDFRLTKVTLNPDDSLTLEAYKVPAA